MYISIHLPKCAGSSLNNSLKSAFGPELFLDYRDLINDYRPKAVLHREIRKAKIYEQILANSFDYEIVHGHFYANKYFDMVKNPKWIVILREPSTLLPSYFQYLQRTPQNNKLVNKVKKMDSFSEFLNDTSFQNIITKMVAPLSVNDFFFIGLMEDYEHSLQQLSFLLNKPLFMSKKNLNPKGSEYHLNAEETNLLQELNQQDIEFYSNAKAAYFSRKKLLLESVL